MAAKPHDYIIDARDEDETGTLSYMELHCRLNDYGLEEEEIDKWVAPSCRRSALNPCYPVTMVCVRHTSLNTVSPKPRFNRPFGAQSCQPWQSIPLCELSPLWTQRF